jgi:ComF family protein
MTTLTNVMGRELGRKLEWAARLVLDGLLPPRCPSCGALVHGPQRLCADCFGRLTFIGDPACLRCGLPFETNGEAGRLRLCATCLAHPPAFARARAALTYDEPARRLLLPFKHADRTELAGLLAMLMRRAGLSLLAEADLLVPVPLHRHRLVQRRYNQSALLAGRLAALAARPWAADALRRSRATAPLGALSAAERRRAVAGAFTVTPSALPRLRGQRILLIDDVLTSGATASACAEVLIAAGAASVDVLVVARVPDPRRRQGRLSPTGLVHGLGADDFTSV